MEDLFRTSVWPPHPREILHRPLEEIARWNSKRPIDKEVFWKEIEYLSPLDMYFTYWGDMARVILIDQDPRFVKKLIDCQHFFQE